MYISNKSYYSFKSGTYIQDSQLIFGEIRRDAYYQRLCSQINDTYNIGGECIMLLFTYNNAHLPYFYNPLMNERVPVFDHNHIRTFLNRLKVYSRRQNLSPYKYFICMEYGENTKRQHYHALFFLSNKSEIKQYVDLCRKIWTNDMNLGFTFPSTYGNPYEKARLQSRNGAASYASKYVTKDISYYSLQSVINLKELLLFYKYNKDVDNYRKVLRLFPRIYQSNGIGASLLKQLNDTNTFRTGILNPLTKKYAPIPAYILNKYLYTYVPAFDNRIGENGNKLYDRVLRCTDEQLLTYNRIRLENSVLDIYNTISQSVDISSHKQLLYNYFNIDNTFDLSDILAKYMLYVRTFSFNMMEFAPNFINAFDNSVIDKFLLLQSDTYARYLECDTRIAYGKFVDLFSGVSNILDDVIVSLNNITDEIFQYKESIALERINVNKEREALKDTKRFKYYPTNLC